MWCACGVCMRTWLFWIYTTETIIHKTFTKSQNTHKHSFSVLTQNSVMQHTIKRHLKKMSLQSLDPWLEGFSPAKYNGSIWVSLSGFQHSSWDQFYAPMGMHLVLNVWCVQRYVSLPSVWENMLLAIFREQFSGRRSWNSNSDLAPIVFVTWLWRN